MMGGIIHKNPTEESFIQWMSNSPESFHWLDMKRFYMFAHAVISYRSSSWLKYDKFYNKIKKHSPYFTDEHIQSFYDLLLTLKEFSKTPCFPLISDNEGKWIERKVKNSTIIDTEIENIHKYMKL